ncbi:LAGLIDADG family homing endonuclease [Halorientalis salina]|uniref:LAGLIDADG family homing endonuclease n=1 Tax=Halorientalis salina TaxID=2932266 RepID=UPI0010ABAC23|nr:LAGLIDADG family homing endonuclease [Halorientalis salina]
MARAEDTEVIDLFEEFYRNYCRNEIGDLAQKYPNEKKSLYVDWQELYRFDPDLADDVRNHPDQFQDYAEEALRLYDLPVDVKLGQAHVRVTNLPETTEIRQIRADHRGMLISVQGIVRKATDVRPKVTTAAFECQRCGTLTRIPQAAGDFQEPHECQGCERQGPFRINYDQSEFVDAQKLRVQESPEGLRGGETPQSIDVNIEDDITGEVTAGDHVRVSGVLQLDQRGQGNEKSPMFDVYMEGHAVEIEDEQFEDMDITDEDKKEIVALSEQEDIYEQMVESIAPSIYGYEQPKMAMILQLFSGVTKHLPDGSRIRGDLHMLLIGDPGTGKCLKGDAKVTLSNGERVPIRELVEENLDDSKPIDDGVYDEIDIEVPSLTADGRIEQKRATKVWKRESPERMYRVETASGRELEVTPSHPLFVQSDGQFASLPAEDLEEGTFIATPRSIQTSADDTLITEYTASESPNAVRLDLPDEWTPWLARLVGYIIAEGHVTYEDGRGDVRVTNEDQEVLDDTAESLDRLGLNYSVTASRPEKSAKVVRCGSGEFASFLSNLEPAILDGSAQQRIPEPLFRASTEIKTAFLRAFIEGEGHVSTKQRELTVASMSRELLEGVRSLLLSLGISCTIEPRHNDSYRLRISGDDFSEYVTSVGFVTDRKRTASEAFEGVPRNTNTDIVPDVGEELRRIRRRLALSQSDCGLPRTTYQHYERGDRNPSRDSLRTAVSAFEDRLAWLHEARERVIERDWDAIETIRRELSISQQALAEGMEISQGAISYYERNEAVPDGGHVEDAADVVLNRIDSALSVEDDVRALRNLVMSDVRWDRIEAIEPVEPDYDWVYDLEVAGTHNYLSNGVVSHNSAMLQYIRNIAPRSVYTSGKGSSSAGLTAAAVRDDFGDGQQWTLEAGALVLADQGIAAVDELDKMRCVTGDTLVHLGNGRISRIRDLAHEAAADGTIEELSNGRTIRDLDYEAWTMTEDGQLVRRPVTAIHEYDSPAELTRVRLQSGETLTATHDHPFFVFEDGERVEKPASALDADDLVYVPKGGTLTSTDGGSVQLSVRAGGEDVELVRVADVQTTDDHEFESVYDLTVDGNHNFVANCMVVHNSEDRSAMHEALEQQSISVSKAGINATLKSRCSLLGAANPKYGRFDQYEPIAEQIDLEPALISRFDLIFTVTDKPDEEDDRNLAEHILTTNYAGELNTHREETSASDYTEEEVARVTDEVAPTIDAELLRKYIAYAKRNVYPTMTQEAKETIREFYVDLRSRGTEEDAPVPVTARKLEALVRLAEASARIRLSDTVEVGDAERVIEIVQTTLESIGMDPETGELDADVIETGTSKSQRDRIKNLKTLIGEIEEEYDEGAPIERVLERAEEAGVEPSKAEHEIEKLKQQGEVYEPSHDHLRTT